MTQAEVYVELTGLDLARVLQLLDGSTQLTEQDLATAVAANKLPAYRAAGLAGRRLEDLVNRVYAEAQIRTAAGTPALTVAFPHVSWFAGVLAAVEIVKQIRGLPVLQGRVRTYLTNVVSSANSAMLMGIRFLRVIARSRRNGLAPESTCSRSRGTGGVIVPSGD